MSSLTSRLKFLVPVVADFADETLYYDNNLNLMESELGYPVVTSLPVTPLFDGQCRLLQTPGNATPPEMLYVAEGGAWNKLGPITNGSIYSQRNHMQTPFNQFVTGTGTEVFETNPIPWIGGVVTTPALPTHNLKMKLEFGLYSTAGSFNGNINLFLNPSGSSQPTPTTPGALRFKAPVGEPLGANTNEPDMCYSAEWFYAPTGFGAGGSMGFSVYLSAINGTAKVSQSSLSSTTHVTFEVTQWQ